MIVATREDIAEQLWLRDEHELARTMLDADESTHRRVMELAAKPTLARLIHNQVDQLLVSAAIEVLTGERRKPRRWRARAEDQLPQFWQEVGPDRDRRSESDPLAEVMRFLDEG